MVLEKTANNKVTDNFWTYKINGNVIKIEGYTDRRLNRRYKIDGYTGTQESDGTIRWTCKGSGCGTWERV